MAKGEKQIKHTDEQKREIVERVCELYESQNATVESCCKVAGVSEAIFRLWLTQIEELGERYKRAKQKKEVNFWEEIIKPLQQTSLERLLKGEVKLEVKQEGKQTGDEFKVTKKTETKSEILPNPAVTIFVTKGLYPDKFADRTKFEGDLNLKTDEWFTKLPLEKRLAILKIANDNTG